MQAQIFYKNIFQQKTTLKYLERLIYSLTLCFAFNQICLSHEN